ncbi:MAG: TonB-dependent receptor [Bacteroidetes bacterium CG02_land_8_20_14_3_00_31_25]|nr:MAG: TonB-dependent receptor [Bacteroidetes bacterium CG02_land_8_20_14_3_00_31_25]
MKFKLAILFCILLIAVVTNAQKYTISGYISDSKSGEKMISASVYDTISHRGTITNPYGFYSLTLPAGKVHFVISFVGYKQIYKEINLNVNQSINIQIEPTISLNEVEIIAKKDETQVDRTQMSISEIPINTIKSLPVIFGEVDVLKSLQLLPGVQSGSEGTSGLYVRGGGPDQNLILLDGVPVYNADHLFGFFSVFNADAIQNVSLIKGGFPARYGGRLSSVIDIRMKEGSNKEFHGEGSFGLIASKFTLEGPLKKDKSSFIVSARRTYIDILAQPFIRAASDGISSGYYFYDVNAKVNYVFSDTDRVFFSVYTGKDKAYSKMKDNYTDNGTTYENIDKFALSWGNITAALRWNHIINPKLFGNLTATYSRYRFQISENSDSKQTNNGYITQNKYEFTYFSGINDISTKLDFDFHPNPNHNILFGINETYHIFSPGINVFKVSDASSTNIDTSFGNSNIYANEIFGFIEDDIRITDRLKANIGVHLCGFYVKENFYKSIQPRLSARYLINEKLSVKAAFSQMNQNLHLLTNSGIGLPTDLWLPVTNNIKPQISYQYAAGVFYDIFKGYEFSIEGFYKTMSNLIEYKEGVDFFGSFESWENKVEVGKGWSYGSEFLIKKTKGKTTGWIGYTLAWSQRQFDNLNFGEKFPYRYDRRHDIVVVITHKLNEKIDFGLTWVFGTGNAVSLGIEKYPSVSNINEYQYYEYHSEIEYYDGRNGFRMPAYHRLDIGINIHKTKKWGVRTWSIGIYNVYNRKNPFYIHYSYDDNNKKRLTQISLFPIIPSFSYNIKF